MKKICGVWLAAAVAAAGLTTQAKAVYLSVYGSGAIEKVDLTAGVDQGLFANDGGGPTVLSLDAAGNLYVAENSANQIVKYANVGGVLSTTPTVFANSTTGTDVPEGLAFDSSGNLYITNTNAAGSGANTIVKYAVSGGTLTTSNTLQGILINATPVYVIFDASGNLYCSTYSAGVIEKYPYANGALGDSNSGTAFASGLSNPTGMVFDSKGDLFVSESSTNEIAEFVSTGGVLSSTPVIFTSNGLSTPYGLTFDSAGNLYAANVGNGTVEKYSNVGGVLSPVGTVDLSGLNQPTYFNTVQPAAVPEPGSLLLLSGGAAGLLMRRRRGSAVAMATVA